MFVRIAKSAGLVLAVAAVGLTPIALLAQAASNPVTQGDHMPSRADIFIGYSFFAPRDTVHPLQTDGSSPAFSFKVESRGMDESASYFFNKHFGVQFESGQHDLFTNTGFATTGSSNSGILTLEPGFIYRFPSGKFTPFVHGLAGATYVDGPEHEPYVWGYGFTAGGGLDYELMNFHHRFAIRLVQADFEHIHADSGVSHYSASDQWVWGDNENINGVKLSAGLVVHFGGIAPPTPVTLAAAASPAVVYAGDPVAVTAAAGHLNPKLHTVYSWSGNGVTGTTARATVATSGLKPGRYTVKAEVKEGKAGKEGQQPWETAEATTSFTVKQFEPPTVSCAASPAALKTGEPSTITASGVSPQNRPLTYSYTASAGTVTGTGSTASYNSTGAPIGTVEVNCTVSDDQGQTATATASLTIAPPYVPPMQHVQALTPIGFSKDKARPARVDNEAKAILDGIALDLGKQPEARLVIVGEADARERAAQARQEKAAAKNKHLKVVDLAAERAVNAKEYLVTEKGIDAGRISVATGTADSQTAENYLVPAGANFTADVPGTTPVDESKVKAQARKPLAAKKHKKA